MLVVVDDDRVVVVELVVAKSVESSSVAVDTLVANLVDSFRSNRFDTIDRRSRRLSPK